MQVLSLEQRTEPDLKAVVLVGMPMANLTEIQFLAKEMEEEEIEMLNWRGRRILR
jgi:hypothetical protein